jgi:hypothetical protein
MKTPRQIDALVYKFVFGYQQSPASEHVHSFSGSIDYAWDVVRKLREENALLSIVHIYNPTKSTYDYIARVEWFDNKNEYHTVAAIHDSAPMAICLAALKYKGVEV